MFFDAFIGSINLALSILGSFAFRVVAAWAHGSFSRIFHLLVTG